MVKLGKDFGCVRMAHVTCFPCQWLTVALLAAIQVCFGKA